MEDEKPENISLIDWIIIREVEERRSLYVTNENTGRREDRLRNFRTISSIIHKETGEIITAEQVERRWICMRKGYGRAEKENKKYYLHDHLKFLKWHLSCNKTPALFSRKEQCLVPAENSSNENERDVTIMPNCVPINVVKKESVKQEREYDTAITISSDEDESDNILKCEPSCDKKESVLSKPEDKMHEIAVPCSPNKGEPNTVYKRDMSCDLTFYFNCNETQYYEKLKNDLANMSELNQVLCMQEILEKVIYYAIKE